MVIIDENGNKTFISDEEINKAREELKAEQNKIPLERKEIRADDIRGDSYYLLKGIGKLLNGINDKNTEENRKALLISIIAAVFSGISLLIIVLASQMQLLIKGVVSFCIVSLVLIWLLLLLKNSKKEKT